MLNLMGLRLIQAVITMLAASFVVFALAHTSGNPADLMLPQDTTPADREVFIKLMGFDRPMHSQYWTFLKNALRGDFGTSIRTREPSTKLVMDRLGNSLKLGTVAIVIALAISVPIGILAAIGRGNWLDKSAMSFALFGQAVPAFWAGIIAVLVFSVWLGWLPTSGAASWKHYILPSATLGWGITAGIVRLLRSSMLDVLDSEYIKLARAKGLREYIVVWKHALRNALIPVITFVGFMYGIIIAGAIVVEVVFAWPGLGRLTYEAVLWRDFPVLQLSIMVWVALIIFINFLVDISYGIIDPRVRIAR